MAKNKAQAAAADVFSLETFDVKLTNINLRAERHGDENVLAADLSIIMKVTNEILVELQPGLKEFLYKEGDDVQQELAINDGKHLTALRFPKMGAVSWSAEYENYTFTQHIGTESQGSNIQLNECKVDKFKIQPMDGGSVELKFRIMVHPDPEQLAKLCGFIQEVINITLVPGPEISKQAVLTNDSEGMGGIQTAEKPALTSVK